MVDTELGKSIKQTQDLLGKYVKKPPLSEKNLIRPPFRFLHDVTTSVINGTGFMNGLFSPEELDSNNISTREAKTEFMRKLIAAVTEATGEDIPVKISKVLSGQEPEKTNILLQALARGIEKFKNSSKPGKVAQSKPKPSEPAGVTKPNTDKKSDTKIAAAKTDVVKGVPVKKSVAPIVKKPASKIIESKPKKSETGTGRTTGASTTQKKIDAESNSGSKGRRKSVTEKLPEQNDADIGTQGSSKLQESSTPIEKLESVSSNAPLKRQNSSLTKLGQADAIGDFIATPAKTENNEFSDGNNGDMIAVESNTHDISNQSTINPTADSLPSLPLSTSPIGADTSSVKFGFSDQLNNNEEPFASSVEHTKDAGSAFKVDQRSEKYEGFQPNIDDDGPSTSKARNYPVNNRLTTARPPSARPAPPRPKSSLFRDSEESNYRPPTGKVTNVLLDNSDVDEDDNFVVREATVAHAGLGGVDETPELALATGTKIDVESALEELAPGDRGLLVDQILETQRQLENRDGARKDLGKDLGVGKSKETSKAEIEKLKNLLQECARNANPLGKLLDYVREDIDAMQKEVVKWREESRTLDSDLEAAKSATETSLQPIQQELVDVEARVADKEDAIAATKMSVIRLQERIEKILSGLDRVQSSHGKLPIPSASELVQGEPTTNLKREDNHVQREGSGFSASLNRLAQTTPGMRATTIFSSSADDLDPDNFDPFKL